MTSYNYLFYLFFHAILKSFYEFNFPVNSSIRPGTAPSLNRQRDKDDLKSVVKRLRDSSTKENHETTPISAALIDLQHTFERCGFGNLNITSYITLEIWNLEFKIWNLEFGIQNLEFKVTCFLLFYIFQL